MSCWTAYLVRDLDGAWRFGGEKRGVWAPRSAEQREEIFEYAREQGVLLQPRERPWLVASWCRGVLLDALERRLRVYACDAQMLSPKVGWVESLERELQRSPDWQGWDLAYAWARRDSFTAYAPELADLVAPEPFPSPPLTELADALLPNPYLLEWDRAAMRLRCDYGFYEYYGALLSVIDERGEVLDFGFGFADPGPVGLSWLVHGPALLDALADALPHPLPGEDDVPEGVLVDCPARVIRYWGVCTPRALLERVREAWPGWQVKRLAYGLAGHLAATGRRDDEELREDSELREGFDPAWVAERRLLPLDPRPLRSIETLWGPAD